MLVLKREKSTSEGTVGLLFGSGKTWQTLELPWQNNIPQVSCIPQGKYLCTLVRSPRFGLVYQVMGVTNRSHILIHAGNYAGDVSLGYISHSYGCILLGLYTGILGKQAAVLASRRALREFMKTMRGRDFELKIEDSDGFC